MSERRKSSPFFMAWGALDLAYICMYVIGSFSRGETPYLSDAFNIFNNILSHGGFVSGAMVLLSYILQLTIILSAALLLLKKSSAKKLCYIQTPFRILLLTPSVFFVGILIPASNLFALFSFVVFSEVVKVISLWRSGLVE